MSNIVPKGQPDLFLPPSINGVGSFRDDMDIMCHPFFSIEKGRTAPMVFEDQNGKTKTRVTVTGADYGVATVWDNDLPIYWRTIIVSALNRGETPSRRIRFNVYDFLRSTKRGTGKQAYELFRASLQRLKATTIITNITADGITLDQGVSWITDYTFVARTRKNGDVVMDACEVELSEWAFQMMVTAKRTLSIDPAYFEITGGLERKLYGVVRKHLGAQSVWHIGLDRLQQIIGSSTEARKFKFAVKKIVERNSLPGYSLELTSDYRLPGVAEMAVMPATKSKKEYLVVRPAPRRLVAVSRP